MWTEDHLTFDRFLDYQSVFHSMMFTFKYEGNLETLSKQEQYLAFKQEEHFSRTGRQFIICIEAYNMVTMVKTIK